ncbi:FeoB-associated Cys-rich membrane protein [Anseongella ginsenosidimutans]|uniref:FeoB-associated Cys-rich membrane protein n=1 Tax=Anseongella ginsenosidimutans TaxID=496056 RepID=UPI001053237E|nr:FeoB-associated Cys-rich membrane protein [Anseongella ginsenosidimutans]QEC52069.1 FeoB-associated Cys-rich membrane protein [Anseongella ginsenosidimutans]
MDVQVFIVGVLFAAALFYVGRIVYRMFRPKPGAGGCASGCGKCGADFSKIGETARIHAN